MVESLPSHLVHILNKSLGFVGASFKKLNNRLLTVQKYYLNVSAYESTYEYKRGKCSLGRSKKARMMSGDSEKLHMAYMRGERERERERERGRSYVIMGAEIRTRLLLHLQHH